MSRSTTLATLASFSGALALVAIAPLLTAPVSLGLLFLSIFAARSRDEAFTSGLLFGVVTGGASIWWAWDALPFLWLGYTSAWEGAYVMAIIWGLVSLGLGVAPALYAGAAWMIRESWYAPLLFAIMWPAAEWGRMWSFALLAAGENSLLGPHFSFAAIGYALVDSAFLDAAAYGGVFALSFAAALMGAVLFGSITRGARGAAALCFLLLIPLALQSAEPEKLRNPISVALVSTLRHDSSNASLQFKNILESTRADVVVFPEDLYLFGSSSVADVVRHVPDGALVAFPYRETGEGGLYRTFVVFADGYGEQSRFQKQFLMPEGEYAPFLSQWIFRIIGDPRVESYFGSVRRLMPGEDSPAFTYENLAVRGRLCSDIISPYLTPRLDTDRASLVVNIGDQTWFNSSRLLHKRQVGIARVRAVETGSYVIVANRGSPSYIIAPSGTQVSETPWDTEGVQYVDLH